MAGIIVATHGNLAKCLVETAEVVVGQNEKTAYVCLDKTESLEVFTEKLKQAREKLEDGTGVIILADMFGGTPCNASVTLFGNDEKVRIITGVNLPLLIEAAMHCSRAASEISEMLISRKDKAIVDVKALFGKK